MCKNMPKCPIVSMLQPNQSAFICKINSVVNNQIT